MSMLKKLMVLSTMAIGLLFAGGASAKVSDLYGEIKYWGGDTKAAYLSIGYQLSDPYAVEVGVFEKVKEVGSNTTERNWSHLYLAGKRSFALSDKSTLYAKLGIAQSDFDHENDTTKHNKKVVPLIAVGAEYKLWKRLYGIVDLSHHGKNHQDIQAITIGIGF